MSLEKYKLTARDHNKLFEFVSVGINGAIKKKVRFRKMFDHNIYNMEFGDAVPDSDEVDDMAVSDNGDTLKILATVAEAARIFLEAYPHEIVYLEGSTSARTRLYQININRFLSEISSRFEVYGRSNLEWKKFSRGLTYESFLVCRRKITFN
ncbi:MAG: hypothetical protein DI535_03135 [Citrobacter freundii]|nr:MAG: hypothetical protein DI535_03135 [Citrobacter freundii]